MSYVPPFRAGSEEPQALGVTAATAAEVREHNRQLQFLSETFPEGVVYQYTVTAGGERLLTYLGRGAERIFGERPEQIPAPVDWLAVRIMPEDQPGIDAAAERSRYDLSRFNHDVRIRTPDGTERWVSFRTQPRELSDGSVVWDGVILDVTARRSAEDAVRRQAEFLAALNQITLDLLGRRKVSDVLQALVARASTLLRATHAEISLLEQGDLVVRAFTAGREYLEGDRVTRAERALSWRAVDTLSPVVAKRYHEHPESRAVYGHRALHAVAVFPIVRDGVCVGVLGLGREEDEMTFSAREIEEGTSLARMAALVLHNAAIHEEAVREAEVRTTALRESEERFRGVFDRSQIAIALLSLPEGRIVELNAASLAVFGYTREEALGRTTLELGVWVDRDVRDRYLQRLLNEESVHGFEAEMRRRNGDILTVIHSGCIVTIAGRPYSLNTLQDITARKQSEAARDHSLALMRATLESTADGILVVNDQGRIETFNRNFAEMWRLNAGLTDDAAEERILHTILDQLAVPEDFLASVRDLYSRSEDEVFDILHCKDGRVFERYSHPQLVGDRLAGRVWSFRDITDRRQAEAELRQSEERFRVLAEVSPVGIFRSDPEGRCTFVNHRWCELAGMSPEQALGEGWKAALHPEDRARIASGWGDAVRAGEFSTAEYRFQRPDGNITWLVGQARAQYTPDGTLSGYVGSITDITQLKQAEEQRKKMEAQLRQSQKMESLGTLAGGIAHDFNNILNGTFGFVDLARLELPTGHAVHPWLDRIAASSQRARELVRQILTFSRKNEGERVPQQLNSVVLEALRLLRSSLPAMVELDSRIAHDAPAALADATQIHQIVLNLCTNAWHALPSRGGRIAVTLEPWTVTASQATTHPDLRPGPAVRLVVSDNGAGMDTATLEHIFEPFFTTRQIGAGTGLGLAVVHGIVKSHDGAIIVRSAPGLGSTFEIYFPAVAVQPPAPVVAESTPPRGSGERVLVVDDDAVSGFVIEKLIESLGYVTTRCTRPEEALGRVIAAPGDFDLVVSDLAMPGMNGEELIEHIHKIRADLPIVIISGYVENARARIQQRGIARAVMRKPVLREELAQVVKQHVLRRA